uniref:Uncharacterized protein n=1 Tax=Anopheles culicifacies TaxID=139723 RepID=A0A182M7Y3_9DIPT
MVVVVVVVVVCKAINHQADLVFVLACTSASCSWLFAAGAILPAMVCTQRNGLRWRNSFIPSKGGKRPTSGMESRTKPQLLLVGRATVRFTKPLPSRIVIPDQTFPPVPLCLLFMFGLCFNAISCKRKGGQWRGAMESPALFFSFS